MEESWQSWEVVIYKITGFICATSFLLVGGYISYYRNPVRVDNFQHLLRIANYCLFTFMIIGLVHSSLVIFYSIDLDIDDKEN